MNFFVLWYIKQFKGLVKPQLRGKRIEWMVIEIIFANIQHEKWFIYRKEKWKNNYTFLIDFVSI